MALSEISNTAQTFTMTVMEDAAIWLMEEEYNDYIELADKRHFRPRFFVQTYVYNSTESNWQDPYRTIEGCEYHIRCIFGDKKCLA